MPKPASSGVAAIYSEAQAGPRRERPLGDIFSRAFEIYKSNPIMILPSLIPIAALVLGFALLAGFVGLTAIIGAGDGFLAFSAIGSALLFIIILIVLFLVAEGLTIEMIKEAASGKKADFGSAWELSRSRMEPLILSSVLAGIVTVVGYLLLIIPGIIMSFAFYFVAQAVMIDGRSGMEALKASWGFFRENLADSLVVILVSMAISIVLPMIPVIGALLSLLSLPYIYGLATLLYLDRKEAPAAKPETQVTVS